MMTGEAMAMLKVISWVIPSIAYARLASSITRPESIRLLMLIPVIVPLPFLPFYFHTLHLRVISAFFLVWLLPFKLVLLSFDLGPLSTPSSLPLPLPTFLAISALPVKLRNDNSPPKSNSLGILLPSAVKSILLFFVISLYQYKSEINPYLLTTIYGIHLYLALDLVLASTALLVGVLMGLEVEPQFDAPFKSTSLQDFWGRRWNLMVTGILRPSVYHPVTARCGPVAGFLATFAVSGLMHEVMVCYISLAPPTGEMCCFFILHGMCTVTEVTLKRKGWWWRRPWPMVATPLTLGFVAATGLWLFFPPILRSGADRIVVEESQAMVSFLGYTKGGAAVWRLFR